jgi:SAM-dependent methyltransferase
LVSLRLYTVQLQAALAFHRCAGFEHNAPMSPIRKPDICQPTGTAELPMLDVYMPMMKTAAIVSAARTGLFEALASGPLETDVLARRIGADPHGARTLADFLVALGYLSRSGSTYANTDSTQRWFTSAGQIDYTPGALWTHEAWAMMGDLSSAVVAGAPQRSLWDTMRDKPHLGPLFSRYMQAFAQDLGPDLIAHVPVADHYTRLLDLGGSHGLHSIRFCRQYPQLTSVIVDMPSALTDTAQTAAQEGLSDRISLQPANLLALDWVQPCDIVLYLSVGHNQHEADNRRVLAEIARSLRPGGLLVIHDYLAEEPLNAFHAAFRLTLLYETGTRTYSHEEYLGWLKEAGFSSVSRVDLNPLEKGSLLLARR